MIHTSTMVTCGRQLCESWTMPDDLAGWAINRDGNLLCPDHKRSEMLVGRNAIHRFPPPEPNDRVHS